MAIMTEPKPNIFNSMMAGAKDKIVNEPDKTSVFLGGIARALMGQHQDSWQAKLGNFASQYGQSGIAAANLKAKEDEQRRFRKMLEDHLTGSYGTGVGLTPKDQDGDTEDIWKVDADGNYTRTIKGLKAPTDGPMRTTAMAPPSGSTGNLPPAGVRQPGVSAPVTQPTGMTPDSGPPPAGMPQGQRFDQSLVPLF